MGKFRCSLFHTIVAAFLLTGCGATQLGMCAPHTKEDGAPKKKWAECFERPFSHAGTIHSVFCLNDGSAKPPVLLLHELIGFSAGTLAYAEELSKDFTVYVPLLFGEKEKISLVSGLSAYWIGGLHEFFPGGEWGIPSQGSAPIVNWLRGVVQQIGERHPQQRIGIICNCMTGTIPLALFDHPQVGAGVAAQPAMPMRFWWYTDADKKSLGISTDDLEKTRGSQARIYGLRFETDCISDPAKLDTLRKEFGERFISGEIPASEYQMAGKPINAHSTLIGGWKKQDKAGQPSRDARERVQEFSPEGIRRVSSIRLVEDLRVRSAQKQASGSVSTSCVRSPMRALNDGYTRDAGIFNDEYKCVLTPLPIQHVSFAAESDRAYSTGDR